MQRNPRKENRLRNVRLGRQKKKKDTKNKERNLTENKVYHTILYSIQLTGRIRVMKKWFHVFFKNRWGRGQPDDIGAINLGDEKFDPDSDKKPRAGQILWIRGLTRLQTQVTIPIFLSFSLSIYLSLSLCLSLSHSLIISSFNKNSIFSRFLSIHENRNEKPKKKKKKTAPGSNRFRWRDHTSHIRSS